MVYDVVVAGAGPVGLFLAGELRLHGVSVLVLEPRKDPGSALKRLPFGMRGLSAPSIEGLHRRGMLDAVVAAQPSSEASGASGTVHWAGQARRPAGHFAGIPFYEDRIDRSQWPWRLPGPAGTSLMVEMEALERALEAHTTAMGADIRRGSGVDSLAQSDDIVTVSAGGEVYHGRWLVGCDGGRSAVRKAAGFAFVGTDPEFTGYTIHGDIAEPNALRPGRHYTPTGMYTYAPPGIIGMVEFDGGACHRVNPITLEHVQAVLRRVSCTDITLTALRLATTWTDRAHQATAYRKTRVLLAGDAAHIHSPLGGQGLNLGLGDAMNLGWKLAATIRGHAPDGLLDTYMTERHPVGTKVLDWSRAQVALMRPSASSRALEAIVRDLVDTRDGATYFAERVWGVSLRYPLGGEHPLIGRSAPDVELADGTRLGEHLRTGKGVLLDFDASAPLASLARRWEDRIVYVSGDAKRWPGARALLVRPDGIVAWATDSDAVAEDVARQVGRWFGEPEGGDSMSCSCGAPSR
ncbi:MAG TPA: FAD-dependent monooxygenase [Luteibacter sp.]|uniref:FAD-dependent monooxygenase n=1 Tax=Luteibacter sp. TaxID=1886636 RepID=UPI002C59FD4F|nr:FAD-dependent monooxygenase [Luteibacter sp.]HVI57133.1 FAD-dependent monooxygenase [Luteibacter sp.]